MATMHNTAPCRAANQRCLTFYQSPWHRHLAPSTLAPGTRHLPPGTRAPAPWS